MWKKAILLPLSCVIVSCGASDSPSDKEDEAKPKPRPAIVGEISSVHPDKGFVLLKQYGPGDLLTGGLYSARSADGRRTVGLVPTGEKLGRFHAADYATDSGVPRVGDVVVMTPVGDDPTPEEVPEEYRLEASEE